MTRKFNSVLNRPLAALLLLTSFTAIPVHADGFFSCFDFLKKQDPQVALEQRIQNSQFAAERTLLEYMNALNVNEPGAPTLAGQLYTLSHGGTWLDAGSGDTIAMAQFFSNQKKSGNAKGIAVTYSFKNEEYLKTINEQVALGRMQVLKGRYFEDIARSELGKVDLITDYFGVFSYTININEVLGTYFDILNIGGTIHMVITNEHNIIKLADGKKISLAEYFRMAKGIEVWPKSGVSNSIILKKTDPNVTIPKLTLTKLRNSAPPIRVFKVVN